MAQLTKVQENQLKALMREFKRLQKKLQALHNKTGQLPAKTPGTHELYHHITANRHAAVRDGKLLTACGSCLILRQRKISPSVWRNLE